MPTTTDHLETLRQLLTKRGNLDPAQEAAAGAAIIGLVGGALLNLDRMADAMERLATPPEMTVTSVDARDWQKQQTDRDEREARTTDALERIAAALESIDQVHGTK